MAQGALDAARAAGAEQYASAIFSEASTSLREAEAAVSDGDYRLALTRALDAYDRAQEAAKGAADGKARARSQAESAVTAAAVAIDQLESHIKGGEADKLPRRPLDAARKAAAAARATVQEARTAVQDEDYTKAREIVRDVPERMKAEIATLGAAATKKPSRRGR